MTTVRVSRDYTAYYEGSLKLTCDCGWKAFGREGEGAFRMCEDHIHAKHPKGGAFINFRPSGWKVTRQWHVTREETREILKEDHAVSV